MMAMRRWLAAILIIGGLGVMAFPKAKEMYFDYRQRQLMARWAEQQGAASGPSGEAQDPGVEEPADTVDPAQEKYILEHMEGMLTIAKIGLTIPVLSEDTDYNLNISVAHVRGTSGPGEVGNYVIAGHHMRTYGRHFNRLSEIREGDTIEFQGVAASYSYKVYETLLVEPEETWVLEPVDDERLITLVTCDYTKKPSLRLVVRGKLVSTKEAAYSLDNFRYSS